MRFSLYMTLAVLALQSMSLQAAPIYKWVDASGVTHFSSQPPSPETQKVRNAPQPRVAPAAAPAAGAPAGQAPAADGSQQQIEQRVQQEVAKTEAERIEYCVQMRTRLSQMRSNPRLRVEENGELRRLDEAERQAKMADAEKAISETCK